MYPYESDLLVKFRRYSVHGGSDAVFPGESIAAHAELLRV